MADTGSAATALLAADREARDAALEVTRSFIVQAPAGSGKTELLIQRFLCLLATVADPEEVVAITFTNKAAAEMRSRVMAALARARRGDEPAADHERRTFAAARRILERDAEYDWRLAEHPGRLRILTLDAFCASITRLLPVSSGLGGSLATSADTDMQRLYREAATATLDWLAEGGARAAAVERVLVHLDNNVRRYVADIAGMLARRDQWLKIIGIGDDVDRDAVRAALEHDLERQVCAQLRAIRDRMATLGGPGERRLLRYAGERLTDSGDDDGGLAELAVNDWPGADPAAAKAWRAIAAALITGSGEIRKRVDRRQGFPPGDDGQKDAFTAWLAALAGEPGLAEQLVAVSGLPDARYRDEQWQVLVALFTVLPLAVAELKRLFSERGVTDHAEVAQAASDALGSVEAPGELALLLDYRIRHLLVDEMQDTSIAQYRLLTQLTAGWEPGDGRTLFCVGDPMQSIYRFRDAEVGRFLAARAHGIGDVRLESLVLRRNFRSGGRLVHWYNETFPRVLPPRDDVTTGAIAYSASIAVDTRTAEGRVEVHPLIDADPAAEAERTATVIERCLEEPGDVAVLVRGRTQLPALLSELRTRGVACRAIEIDRLTDLPEIIELLAITRALCHDADRLAWLALLRSPLVGLTWADLLELARNDRGSTLAELVADDERLGAMSADGRTRLAELLDVLARDGRAHGARGLRERVERLWLALEGPALLRTTAELDNVYRFLDVLESLETGGTLADVATLESMLDEERVSSPGDEDTRVQVMTMHKAKGLEFDHVVLHALGRRTAGGSRDVLAWLAVTHDDGSGGLVISPPGPQAERERDPLQRFIERAAAESDGFELGRLLYVACTRAVRSLHLVASATTRARGAELGVPSSTTLLAKLWPVVAAHFEKAFAAAGGEEETEEGGTLLAEPASYRLETTPSERPAPPPSRPGYVPARDREVSYDWVGAAARHAGTIVHRWLYRAATGRLPDLELPADFDTVSARWARSLGVPAGELASVVARVRAAVTGALDDGRGRWLLAGEGHAELALRGVLGGRIVGIAIDRVRIDDDGVHWLVDYKTGSHEGGDIAGFLRAETARYRDQLQRYRDLYAGMTGATVRTALYYPLLGEWVEVDVDAEFPGPGDSEKRVEPN